MPNWPPIGRFSDDGLQLVLELEHDVSFHDGTELTADVVVKNFERWGSVNELLGAERLRQVGRLPYSVVFGGYFDQDACLLASVEASSEHIVTLTFTEPIQALIRSLTHPHLPSARRDPGPTLTLRCRTVCHWSRWPAPAPTAGAIPPGKPLDWNQ